MEVENEVEQVKVQIEQRTKDKIRPWKGQLLFM
jgi:hypothetical protein